MCVCVCVCVCVWLSLCVYALVWRNYLADFDETFQNGSLYVYWCAFVFQLINIIDGVKAAILDF